MLEYNVIECYIIEFFEVGELLLGLIGLWLIMYECVFNWLFVNGEKVVYECEDYVFLVNLLLKNVIYFIDFDSYLSKLDIILLFIILINMGYYYFLDE